MMGHPAAGAALASWSSLGWGQGAAAEWRLVEFWTLMYRGGLLAGAGGLVAFVAWRAVAAQRERARLEALVASRTRQFQQSEELFRSIFEHAAEGIFQSSLDGHNLRANPAMTRICGYANPRQMREELTDVANLFYVQPQRRTQIMQRVAQEGTVLDCESEIRRRDGSTIWIAESVQSVIDPATGETVYQGSIVDITARKEMREAQDQARSAAEASNRAKSMFLARMTHELRTPLTGILGSARVALQDTATDLKNRDRYRVIVEGGEHLLRLIDGVLDHSRIEAGRLELRPGPFDLSELLRAVTGSFQPRAQETRLALLWEADAALPRFCQGDALRLRQVLDNLLSNAFKFTDQGQVMLRVQRREPALVRFEVEDTGIGVPADQLEAIFQPFQQSVAPGRPVSSGVGLGLNISARLVELMGGLLRVESTPAQGSRFFFEILLPDADHGETLQDAQAKQSSGTTVLAGQPPVPLLVPPPEMIEALTALSLAGDIIRLRQSAAEICRVNPAYTDFTRELVRLADTFRMDAIGRFLQQARLEGSKGLP